MLLHTEMKNNAKCAAGGAPDINVVIARLKGLYPDSACSLEYENDPWKLLVAARLSAQCTDARVNIVIKDLFAEFPDVHSTASAEIAEIERIIKPCGLYRMKAKNIVDAAVMLERDFGGKVPDSMEKLLILPGVGRKIANLLLGDVYGIPGIVADTHCIRINGRLGYYPESVKDPVRVENILREIVPEAEQTAYCHRIVDFGREWCMAKEPRCGECPLGDVCKHRTAK